MYLPPELYRPIIEHVGSKADLYRLLFVSQTVSYEAERALYHTIRAITDQTRIQSSIKLFFHLSRCPRVAQNVQKLEITGGVHFQLMPPGRIGIVGTQHYWHIINTALCALTHLRILILSNWICEFSSSTARGPPPEIFSNCPFKLEVLKLTDYSGNELPPLDLTHVKELSLENSLQKENHKLRCRPGAFPSLQVLATSPSQFLELGTRNTDHVKALDICNTLSNADIIGTFASIISLKIRPGLWDAVLSFPSLRFLQMFVGVSQMYIGTPLSTTLEALANLRNLEKLCVLTYNPTARYPLDLHRKFFAAIGSLMELILSCDMQRGEFWKRDDGKSVSILAASFMDEWKDPQWLKNQ